MPPDVTLALRRALAALIPALDIVEGRAGGGATPAWCDARGWTSFLLSLDDRDLVRCEQQGLAASVAQLPGVPPSLASLAREAAEAARVPILLVAPLPQDAASMRSVRERKRLQLPALLGAVKPMAERAARIVDVGAGHGHFARMAATTFDREALGLERESARVATASALAAEVAPLARFVALDVGRDDLDLRPDDLAVGLHACGALGDRVVIAASRAGCDLVLVSCCLQKIEGPSRAPLSREAASAGLVLRRDALGLTNLSARAEGVEVSLETTMEARRARHALALLLFRRGLDVPPGEEMRGINRRRARRGLRVIAEAALRLRELPPPTEAELSTCEADAAADFARMRRLSLPRSMLARLCEAAVVLDRAAALAEGGHDVRVAAIFDAGVSPRNLAILASRAPLDPLVLRDSAVIRAPALHTE